MTISELKKKRLAVLARRADSSTSGEFEACNAELRKLNLAIQGVEPYEDAPKPKAKSPRKKKTQEKDVLS